MLGMIESFIPLFNSYGIDVTAPQISQTMSEDELKLLLPEHDAWIIGDDPATRAVFAAGKSGKLKAAVKWGIGVDNVDFQACKDFGIPISNTPNMFGSEVADVAVGYVIALARETFLIDREVREGKWIKPRGISLSGKTVALIGLGDIGANTAKRLIASGMNIIAYDPVATTPADLAQIQRLNWPNNIENADFIVITCALTESSYHMIDAKILEKAKNGVRIVNVSRGPIIDESELESALQSGKVYSAALDVFEQEPLSIDSYLRKHSRCILGSHNASNTTDAVIRTSTIAIYKLIEYLSISKA